jgi:predicted dehydrogenase
MSKLRTAVIGVGMIGNLHARIYSSNPRCELVAVCDADPARADTVAKATDSKAYSDPLEMLGNEQLDAVSIATPETIRIEPAFAAAERGIALLIEKPLGRSLDAVRHLVEGLEARNARAAVNFILHAEPRYARMKQIVRAGEIGRTVSFFARRRGTRLGMQIYGPWTDLLSSTLIHDIEMVLAASGSYPERIFAEAVVRECAPFGSQDAVFATIRLADGAIAAFETSWVLPELQPEPLEPALHVVGDAGAVIIEGSSQGMRVLTKDSYRHPDMTHWPMLGEEVGGALRASIDSFVHSVATGTEPLVGLRAALAAEAAVDAIKRSIATGAPVLVDPELVTGAS